MNRSMIGASLMLGALLLTGCKDTRPTCYGVEPDGEEIYCGSWVGYFESLERVVVETEVVRA